MTPGFLLSEWAALLAATLEALGVRRVIASPGSRSTPYLAALLRSGRFAVHVAHDERAAAFLALGAARVESLPPLLLCTSGSALAHYAPAVVEADAAELPLLVLSANRPPALQGCGAAQTTDQHRFFGGHVRAFHDLGVPGGTAGELDALVRRLSQAVLATRHPRPGPVHLDGPCDKPLEPVVEPRDEDDLAVRAARVARQRRGPTRVTPPGARPDPALLDAVAGALLSSRRPLLAAGPLPLAGAALAAPLARIARATGAPMMAESASQLRHGELAAGEVTLLGAHDLVWDAAPGDLAPDLVVRLGAPPTSEAYSRMLERTDPAVHVLAERPWPDPEQRAVTLVLGDLLASVTGLADRMQARGAAVDRVWVARLARLDRQATDAARQAEREAPPPFEGKVVARTFAAVPPHGLLMLGNSLPIREVDLHVPPLPEPRRILVQRGVHGIDGLVSGAVGAALAAAAPVTLLVGDVSLLHDLGGLALAARERAPVRVVAIDNGGGRIFEQLPVARNALTAARLDAWVAPHGLDLGAIGCSLGVTTTRVDDEAQLDAALRAPLEGGPELVVARVEPGGAAAFRARARALLGGEA